MRRKKRLLSKWNPAMCIFVFVFGCRPGACIHLCVCCALCVLSPYRSCCCWPITKIHFDDSHFVCRWISRQYIFSTLFSLARSPSIARWCCWKLITLGFIHFHRENSLNFSLSLNWVSTLFKCFFPFSLCVSLEYIFTFNLKKTYKRDEEKKTIQPQHTQNGWHHTIYYRMCERVVYFSWRFESVVHTVHWTHWTIQINNRKYFRFIFSDNSRLPMWVFIVHCLCPKDFCCMWNSQRQQLKYEPILFFSSSLSGFLNALLVFHVPWTIFCCSFSCVCSVYAARYCHN